MARGHEALAPCVHCGFCLTACPTYLATGDENDSPRGRIALMQALDRGDIPATDPHLIHHLDTCLGCRGCEPACPSGVAYGEGLQTARRLLVESNGLPTGLGFLLGVFSDRALWRPLFTAARWLRATGISARVSGSSRLGFSMGMLAASAGLRNRGRSGGARSGGGNRSRPVSRGERVVLFRGCVMDTLFAHVHDATRRTLIHNGYEVLDVPRQECCGALHEHAGQSDEARRLARLNIERLQGRADYVVVDSAGCGALLKDYGALLEDDSGVRFADTVRDVTELLAEAGPAPGAPVPLDVVYDAPCHLQHAQKVHDAPLRVLGAVPELRVRLAPGYDRCCGSAGLYSVIRPEMARAVLRDKVEGFLTLSPQPSVVTSGNPGCLMQIGAGLLAAGSRIAVVHPVELLDRSYREAGYYVPSP